MLFKVALLVAVLSCVSEAIDHSLCKLDVVLCLDNTGSIGYFLNGTADPSKPPKNWKLITDFSQDIVKELTISSSFSQVGLVDFGGRARIQFGLTQYPSQAEVLDAIAKVAYIGDTTNTTGGLYKSRLVLTDPQYGSRAGVAKLVILITDGNPNVDADKVLDEAQNLRSAGIRVSVVGISFADEELMRKIAYTPEDYIYAEDFSDLESIKSLVLNDQSCKPIPTTTTTTTTTAKPTTTTTTKRTPPAENTIGDDTPEDTPAPEPIIYC